MSKYKKYDWTLLDERVIAISDEPEKMEKITSPAAFNNENPLVVEIGCGNGHFLTTRAREENDKNFVGIDIKAKRIIRCREKQVKFNLDNMLWINGEAFTVFDTLLNRQSVSEVFMLFPDPWPKKRHHKHRLFQKEFINCFYEDLIEGGTFTFLTDYEEYYDWSFSLIKSDKRFEIVSKDYSEDLVLSIFGEKWKRDNRSFYSFTIKKI